MQARSRSARAPCRNQGPALHDDQRDDHREAPQQRAEHPDALGDRHGPPHAAHRARPHAGGRGGRPGPGGPAALLSVVVKTALLYLIMVTGSIWEKVVVGRWLFAPAFYWEDMVSMLVIGLHSAYLYVLVTGAIPVQQQMYLALAAYATYAINAAQFLWKLRKARVQHAQLGLHGQQAAA